MKTFASIVIHLFVCSTNYSWILTFFCSVLYFIVVACFFFACQAFIMNFIIAKAFIHWKILEALFRCEQFQWQPTFVFVHLANFPTNPLFIVARRFYQCSTETHNHNANERMKNKRFHRLKRYGFEFTSAALAIPTSFTSIKTMHSNTAWIILWQLFSVWSLWEMNEKKKSKCGRVENSKINLSVRFFHCNLSKQSLKNVMDEKELKIAQCLMKRKWKTKNECGNV